MGNVFENLDDLDVVKRLVGDNCRTVEYGDDDLIDDQAGKAIMLDNVFELIPFKTKETYNSITGDVIHEVVKWHLTAYHTISSYRWDEPDDVDEVEMGTNLGFEKAICMILHEITDWGISNDLESMMYEDLQIQEEKHPEEAWPEPEISLSEQT